MEHILHRFELRVDRSSMFGMEMVLILQRKIELLLQRNRVEFMAVRKQQSIQLELARMLQMN